MGSHALTPHVYTKVCSLTLRCVGYEAYTKVAAVRRAVRCACAKVCSALTEHVCVHMGGPSQYRSEPDTHTSAQTHIARVDVSSPGRSRTQFTIAYRPAYTKVCSHVVSRRALRCAAFRRTLRGVH